MAGKDKYELVEMKEGWKMGTALNKYATKEEVEVLPIIKYGGKKYLGQKKAGDGSLWKICRSNKGYLGELVKDDVAEEDIEFIQQKPAEN